MAGEYQLAEQLLESGLESAGDNSSMDEVTFARAMMYQLIEHNRKSRTEKDIVGEIANVLFKLANDVFFCPRFLVVLDQLVHHRPGEGDLVHAAVVPGRFKPGFE